VTTFIGNPVIRRDLDLRSYTVTADWGRDMRYDSGQPSTRPVARPRTVEGATAAILAALPPDEWTVFDGVRLAGRRTPLQVAVGPQGVFVVESRPRPRLGSRDEIRPGGVRQDVVVAATRCAVGVSALSGLVPARHIVPVVCFLGREVEPVVAGDVVICSSRNLLAVLTTGPVVLDEAQRQLLAMDLDTSIGVPAAAPKRAPRRRWLRAQIFGLVIAASASVGLWGVVDSVSGPHLPGQAAVSR
jgi:hypothetical protein